jgi:hypothetical protein
MICVGLALCASCGPAVDIRGTLAVSDPENRSMAQGANGSAPIRALADVQARIFLPSCAGSACHAPPTPAMDLDLTAAVTDLAPRLRQVSKESLTGIPLVTPGAYGDSYLYLKVFLSSSAVGDPMPPSAPLDKTLIAGMRAWIQAGAP